MQLPFGEWLPDQPEHLNPGATVATNVYHAQTSYKPVKGLVAYSSNNIVKNAKGAGSFRNNTNTVFTFVATKTDIFQLTAGTFTSRKSGLTGGDTDFFTFTPSASPFSLANLVVAGLLGGKFIKPGS